MGFRRRRAGGGETAGESGVSEKTGIALGESGARRPARRAGQFRFPRRLPDTPGPAETRRSANRWLGPRTGVMGRPFAVARWQQ